MLIVDRDGSLVESGYELPPPQLHRGYAELTARPGVDLAERIEQLLSIAFDSLRLHVLEVRVREDCPL